MAALSPLPPASARPTAAKSRGASPWLLVLQAVLLVATVVSMMAVGMRYMANFRAGFEPLHTLDDIFPFPWAWAHRGQFELGIPFALTLLAILLAHEFGHYFAARVFGVSATLPFVLPAPSLTGTFGAVIRLKSAVRTRRALLAIAASGPIAGFVVACAGVMIGLALSRPLTTAPVWLVPLNEPPLTLLLRPVVAHGLGVNRSGPLLWHPVLLASWFGLLITMLNLIPAGQLDGGHILFTFSPRVHTAATRTAIIGLGILGVFCWAPWLLWVGLLLMPAMRRPYVINRRQGFAVTRAVDDRRQVRGQGVRVLAPICLVIALLCAIPIPFHQASLLEIVRHMGH